MTPSFDTKQVQEVFTQAQTIFVVLPNKANFDKVAAATGLFLSLKKAGKNASIGRSMAMTVEHSSLVGVDKIQSKLGGQNLVISFDYLKDSIEKVSYNIENNKFNLTIQPKSGFAPLSADKVQYSYSGGQVDLIVIVGAGSLADLGEFYQANKEIFDKTNTLALDIFSRPESFAKVNFWDNKSAAYSETVANLLARLQLPVDADIASNLMAGIKTATGNFSSPRIGPATFEAAAFCLRAGARWPRPAGERKKVPLRPMPAAVSANKPPEVPQTEEPRPDWLEPKIYKGNTKI